jgi:glycosyltransferase involved in cell wall biosynthesis
VESARRAGQNVEIIVVDDASTDSTSDVCSILSDIKYVRLDRNQGVAGARNVGLLESTGDFVAFLDDDDLRLPGSLDHQVSLLEADPEAGFVAGGVILADQDCVPSREVAIPQGESGDLFWRILELSVHIIPGSVVVRRECFLEIGLFDRQLAGIDDWDLWTRIAEVRSVLLDHEPVCIYRVASPSSGQGSSMLSKHLYSAVKHQLRLLLLPRAQKASPTRRRAVMRNTRRRIADTLSWRAAEALPQGALRFAASNFFVALRVSPLWAVRPTHLRVLHRSAVTQLRTRLNSRRPSAPAPVK